MLEGKSFIIGIAAGIVLRWTDIIPIIAGIMIGISIKKIPDVLNTGEFPVYVQTYIDQIKNINDKKINKNI